MPFQFEFCDADWEVLESALNSAEEALMTDIERCRYESQAQPHRRDLENLQDLWDRLNNTRDGSAF
jgi:hypothetical protein